MEELNALVPLFGFVRTITFWAIKAMLISVVLLLMYVYTPDEDSEDYIDFIQRILGLGFALSLATGMVYFFTKHYAPIGEGNFLGDGFMMVGEALIARESWRLTKQVRDMSKTRIWPIWLHNHQSEIDKISAEYNPLYELVDFKHELRVPDGLRDILVTDYGLWLIDNQVPTKSNVRELWNKATPEQREKLFSGRPNVKRHAQAINRLMELVPAKELIGPGKQPLYDLIKPTMMRAAEDDSAHSYFICLVELEGYIDRFKSITFSYTIPESLRVEHHQILANPGHGKSTLLTQMFFEDLKKDCAIVLIDSQGDLINDLAVRVPAERLVLIDPVTCPPALNIFAQKTEGEQGIMNALNLFEYVFASLGVGMTGKQEMVYRYLSRLCMMIPGGSINTLRSMLGPSGTEPYQAYIDKMSENAKAFFVQYQLPTRNQFSETRQEILTRLLKVLESTTFESMLGAREMKINIAQEIDAGKVILISTAKNHLGVGSSLLGRIFVAQVMQAVRNRPQGKRKRVYLYIDEFADYAEDSSILLDCFAQGRKYELGMIIAHQNLDQLTPKLAAAISSSTAIKFAGGVSSEDSRKLASQMRVDYRMIDRQPKGTFLAYFKDVGTLPWPVQLGFINTIPPITDLADVQRQMRAKYGKSVLVPEPQYPKLGSLDAVAKELGEFIKAKPPQKPDAW